MPRRKKEENRLKAIFQLQEELDQALRIWSEALASGNITLEEANLHSLTQRVAGQEVVRPVRRKRGHEQTATDLETSKTVDIEQNQHQSHEKESLNV